MTHELAKATLHENRVHLPVKGYRAFGGTLHIFFFKKSETHSQAPAMFWKNGGGGFSNASHGEGSLGGTLNRHHPPGPSNGAK